MNGRLDIPEALYSTKIPDVDIVRSNKKLAASESDLVGEIDWHIVLNVLWNP
jgi:hypothetical protein